MSSDERPPLEACGFVRVPADKPLWMKCDACGKSDHFWLADGIVHCRCGAQYDHAVRPDGQTVPFAELTAVPFHKGPVQLSDLEWDPVRLGTLIAVLLAALGAGAWWFLG